MAGRESGLGLEEVGVGKSTWFQFRASNRTGGESDAVASRRAVRC